jgi:hypothetical protein
VWIVHEGDAALVSNAEILAVDAESVEMTVFPADGGLKDGTQVGEREVSVNKQPSPDHRADAA